MGYSLRVIDQRDGRRKVRCQECGYVWWSRNPTCAALLEA
jgi:uncharacterized Zn finger protein